jgi:hypothetical protein
MNADRKAKKAELNERLSLVDQDLDQIELLNSIVEGRPSRADNDLLPVLLGTVIFSLICGGVLYLLMAHQ